MLSRGEDGEHEDFDMKVKAERERGKAEGKNQ